LPILAASCCLVCHRGSPSGSSRRQGHLPPLGCDRDLWALPCAVFTASARDRPRILVTISVPGNFGTFGKRRSDRLSARHQPHVVPAGRQSLARIRGGSSSVFFSGAERMGCVQPSVSLLPECTECAGSRCRNGQR